MEKDLEDRVDVGVETFSNIHRCLNNRYGYVGSEFQYIGDLYVKFHILDVAH